MAHCDLHLNSGWNLTQKSDISGYSECNISSYTQTNPDTEQSGATTESIADVRRTSELARGPAIVSMKIKKSANQLRLEQA